MKRTYLVLALYTSVFVIFGLVFIYSAGISMEARHPDVTASEFLEKQLIAYAIGLAGALIMIYMKGSWHFKNAFTIYYPLTLIMLVAVLFFPDRGGSNRWIDIGSFSLQVSEFAKISLLLVLAKHFGGLKKRNFLTTFLIPLGITAPLAILVFIEPDLSTTGIIVAIAFVMMIIGGIKMRYLSLALIFVVILVLVLYSGGFIEDYQIQRITSFLTSLTGEEHEQVSYSLMAISSGGLTGKGLGMGLVKYYLPVSYSDFIFAVIGEELGLVGLLVLMFAYVGFIRELIVVGLRGSRTLEGKLYIIGFALYIMIQATINIGVNLGLFPPTGVTLPFVSSGGSSIMSLMIGYGLVFSILLESEEEKEKGLQDEKT
ncbi:bacterial cell division membrane protein [Mesotoga prima MesG1.Ag.4.2]|uniref:Probable peptidoglycan glycosyltransferase FtsW n=1 Tax=Mesotoga prima MesG1.Ag.4.2 TaxID=660470 RepID=I2F5G8_9BACT|nr:FtsW/RodA/SpoVE family cell cycle protein [Mesotoga prima]AFK07171.1 bacterial cell division membrane protein [Mesotoga prima MesG1.Ag.4.2]